MSWQLAGQVASRSTPQVAWSTALISAARAPSSASHPAPATSASSAAGGQVGKRARQGSWLPGGGLAAGLGAAAAARATTKLQWSETTGSWDTPSERQPWGLQPAHPLGAGQRRDQRRGRHHRTTAGQRRHCTHQRPQPAPAHLLPRQHGTHLQRAGARRHQRRPHQLRQPGPRARGGRLLASLCDDSSPPPQLGGDQHNDGIATLRPCHPAPLPRPDPTPQQGAPPQPRQFHPGTAEQIAGTDELRVVASSN